MDTESVANRSEQSEAYASMGQKVNTMSVVGEIVAPIGTKPDGETFFQDLSQIPHFLVCGFSGAGKTTFVQTVTMYVATQYSASKAKFIIYDSKQVDYTAFNSLPHLLMPVISDSPKAAGVISWLSSERKRRFKILADKSAKDIISYNKQCEGCENDILPHLFVILDDFSSLNLTIDTATALMDVLKNGRPVGIHFILVTSLTSSKVLQKDILSNIPCRISFCVSTRADSKVAIEQSGAESLHVPGELIFRWQNNLVKCQGVYLQDDDVEKAIKKLQRQSKKNVSALGNMAAQIFDNPVNNRDKKLPTTDVEEDELFPCAVEVLFETGQASVSMIQRRFKLGYSRAAKLVDMMEKRGIVGPFDGSKPRQILITKDQWRTTKYGNTAAAGTNIPTTNNRRTTSSNMSGSANEDSEEISDIEMRNFAQFHFNNVGLCIAGNQIKISNRIMTKLGPGTSTASFNGKSVAGLEYKKPHLFSRGYIQFRMKPNVKIINDNSHLITITKDNISDILKIEFGNDTAHTMLMFMTQISEDIGVPLSML